MVVPAGTYTFTNFEYNASSLNLYENSEVGPVTGLKGDPQKWTVAEDGSQNTIKLKDTATYVGVPTDAENVALDGSTSAYYWTAIPVSGTQDRYYFVNEAGTLSWYLTADGDRAVIVLKAVNENDAASQWTLVAV